MADVETLRRDLRRAMRRNKPRWLGLSWRMRLSFWRMRRVNAAGIWLTEHGHNRAAARLWRIRL